LAAVASDIFGVSGWAMLERIAQGETDAAALAMEARGALRKKNELEEALAGELQPVYRFLLRQHMQQVRLVLKQIDEIQQALAVRDEGLRRSDLPALPIARCRRGCCARDRGRSRSAGVRL
jgi:hypothetical protein